MTATGTGLLVPDDPAAVARELGRSRAASPEAAEAVASAGGLLEFQGSPVLLTVQPDPLLGSVDVFAGFVDPAVLAARGRLAALLDAMFARHPQADRAFVRSGPGVAVAAPPGLRPLLRYLAKRPEPDGRMDQAGEDGIRPAGETTSPFVRRLLADALVRGYAAAGCRVGVDAALAYVRAAHPRIGAGSAADALVAFDGEDPVGHVTWLPDSEDDLTAATYWELVDVETLDKGRGHGARLLAALERRAAAAGATLLGNVVAEPGRDAWVALYQSLCRSGWSAAYDIWMCRRGDDAVVPAGG